MEEKLQILEKWVATGQVKTARGRSHDDLLTLIGQMKVALRQPPVIGRSELLLDFLAWFGRTYSPEKLKVVGMQQLINEYEKSKQ